MKAQRAHTSDPSRGRSTFPVQYVDLPKPITGYAEIQPTDHPTADEHIARVVDEYRRSGYMEDLTCKRTARIAFAREVRVTYRQAVKLIG